MTHDIRRLIVIIKLVDCLEQQIHEQILKQTYLILIPPL